MFGLIKFFTGFTMAIAILFFAGVSLSRYAIARLTILPPKPMFPNDNPPLSPVPTANPVASSPTTAPSPTVVAPSSVAPTPSVLPSVSPTPSPTSETAGYQARVVQPIGLILRDNPSRDSSQIGGVEYNEAVVVLETSSDGEWLRVQLPGSNMEGWIKAGNTEK
ncbi:MAG: SH3 domain-containing protein [Leptolyngbyaceae cyanobacterium SL_7_1]|nr:SH3 domain-containing protein [Leptolyngbyaceae cyanobacterium SL_7_1]